MANNDTVITIRGWAGANPVVYQNQRENDRGNPNLHISTVVNVGVTPRSYSRQTGQYNDGETSWYSVRTFGKLAENVAACVQKGSPVIVRGKLTSRSFKAKDGSSKISQVIMADSLGIEISSGVAKYIRATETHQNLQKEKDFPGGRENDEFCTLSDLSEGESPSISNPGLCDPWAVSHNDDDSAKIRESDSVQDVRSEEETCTSVV